MFADEYQPSNMVENCGDGLLGFNYYQIGLLGADYAFKRCLSI